MKKNFPILETKSKWLETAKREDYFEILNKYNNVKMIVSGHHGANLEKNNEGIYHIITENYNKNYAYKIIQMDLQDDFMGTYLVK